MNTKLLLLIVALGMTGPAFADDDATSTAPAATPTQQGHHRHRHGSFKMGVCVGQNLAQQGVTLPAPQPGQKPAFDAATKAAFKTAMQACRAELHPASGSSGSSETTPSS